MGRDGATATAALVLTMLAASVGAGGPAEPPREDLVEHGRNLYRVYCRGCHGNAGRGDGPAADGCATRPADLTRLGPRGRAFPGDQVYRAIEGLDRSAAHASSDMPAWGLAFRQDGLDAQPASEIRTRIRQLVGYLESIQVPSD